MHTRSVLLTLGLGLALWGGAGALHASQELVLTAPSSVFPYGRSVTMRDEPAVEAWLDALVRTLRAHPRSQLAIEVHTDSTGSAGWNQALSEERARTLRAALAARGIPRRRLRARGFGEERPIANNSTAEGRHANSRVELRWGGLNEEAGARLMANPAITAVGALPRGERRARAGLCGDLDRLRAIAERGAAGDVPERAAYAAEGSWFGAPGCVTAPHGARCGWPADEGPDVQRTRFWQLADGLASCLDRSWQQRQDCSAADDDSCYSWSQTSVTLEVALQPGSNELTVEVRPRGEGR